MAIVAWGSWQEEHITRRHRVTAGDFDAAWHDPYRRDLAEENHEEHGPYYVSVGNANGKPLKMVWRWQKRSETIWPITAFFLKPSRIKPSRKR